MTKKRIYTNIMIGLSVCCLLPLLLHYKNTEKEAKEEKEVDYVIGVSQPNLLEPWQVLMYEELTEEAAKHHNIRVIYTDAAHSSAQQIEEIETLKSYGIDLLIVSVDNTAALTPVISKVYEEIPVIVLGRGVEGYNYTLYIGSDHHFIGEMAAEAAMQLLGDKGGDIIELQGVASALQVEERSEGFREKISENSAYKITDSLVANWQRDKAEDKLKELLRYRHDLPDLIYAYNDAMALGARKALEALHLKGVYIIGSDGVNKPDGGLQLVKDKKVDTTFITPTGGKEAIQYAIEILNQEAEIPKKIIVRNHQVTPKNVNEYLQQRDLSTNLQEDKDVKVTLGFAQVGKESGFRAANTSSIIAAAKDEGVNLKLKNANNDQEKQVEIIRGFIKQGVDVIAFSPKVEHGWDEVLQEAKDAGIPVILSDREIEVRDSSLWTSFIGSDFVEEGRRAARWLVNGRKTPGKEVNIIELEGTSNAAPSIGRKEGFEEVLHDHHSYRILDSLIGDFTYQKGKEMMAAALARYGRDIDVVYAHNDDMAIGAIEAIDEYGLRPGKDIKIISIDATKKALTALSIGKLNFSVECNPLLGPQLMKSVKDLKAGKEIPMKIITSEKTFTKEEAKQEILMRHY
ncbi:substrate-binding domain-containing protein [Bacillus sp. mrc49]|uniref:substrate-binding domain-containing protein n=2 Tax=Bacillus sp. mrc49 TaxID=2054913 RepID=UPI000C26E377|nr:substrate-binding domain-containing protein [Bacillus sp. mrc49]PJN87711.1 LacI family transcriptional regulator [Bacillus sp. mrc49]